MRKKKTLYDFVVPSNCRLPEEQELYRRLQMTNSRGDEQGVFDQLSAKYPVLLRNGATLQTYITKLHACFLPKSRWQKLHEKIEGWAWSVRTWWKVRLASWR
ncbi:MAG: hypothetical protein JWO13_2261 [Acidobacteriales bacterium]|nr:hypothetical protein [Terriglobales bacterium]